MVPSIKHIFSKILILLILSSNIFADPPQWDPNGECVLNNYPDYENNGSITARVYSNEGLESGELGLPKDNPLPGMTTPISYVIVGDEAFPLKENIMKPYPMRMLDNEKCIFNYNTCSTSSFK